MRLIRRVICALNQIHYVSDEGIILQRHRHSCGLACVQMLLVDNNIKFGRDVLNHSIGPEGMSMLDMACTLEQYGHKCRGVRFVNLCDLAAALHNDSNTKAIVVLHTKQILMFHFIVRLRRWLLGKFGIPEHRNDHWVVVHNIDSSKVCLRDPALGLIEMSEAQFQYLWTGYTLMVYKESQQASTSEHDTVKQILISQLTSTEEHSMDKEELAYTNSQSPTGSIRSRAPVVIEKVSYVYQQRVLAVRQVSFDLLPGEVFCLLGPNGAGKTTIIKMITAVLPPSSGRVIMDGVDVWEASDSERAVLRRSIGYMPERPFLYDTLTPREYMFFIGELCGIVDRTLLRERIAHHLHVLHLEDKADTRIRKLSHGMRRKVAFIASQLHDPRLLLLDEPTLGLDPTSSRLVKDRLRELSDTGHTVLMTTHVLEIAERLADRIGIIDHGVLLFVGTLNELQNTFGSPDASLEDLFLKLIKSGTECFHETDLVSEEGIPHA